MYTNILGRFLPLIYPLKAADTSQEGAHLRVAV